MNKGKNPCRNCIYFKQCGENTRTKECKGRQLKGRRIGRKYEKNK